MTMIDRSIMPTRRHADHYSIRKHDVCKQNGICALTRTDNEAQNGHSTPFSPVRNKSFPFHHIPLITFRMSRRRRETYSGHSRLSMRVCLCVCLRLVAFPHYCTDPDLTSRNGRGPVVVHYWADLQSVHGFRCCDNIVPNAKCQRVLILALCPVVVIIKPRSTKPQSKS